MITFQNPDTIDIRSITTFGTSSKQSSSAIGYFGTGLKYAIAILLREGCEVTIESGNRFYRFTAERETLRNDEFDFIYMHQVGASAPPIRLAFTTDLGKNWLLWQAFRELYSNLLDEQGTAFGPDEAQPEHNGGTTIRVSGSKFDHLYAIRTSIFLESEAQNSSENTDLHTGKTDCVFYKDVRIHKTETPYAHTYNISSHITLTEDRTPANPYEISRAISRFLMEQASEVEIIAAMQPDVYESQHLDWSWGHTPSEHFLDTVCANLHLLDRQSSLACLYHRLRPPVFAPVPHEMTQLETRALEKAQQFVLDIGIEIPYPIKVVESLDGALAQARDETVWIAKSLFGRGVKYIALALVEEVFHLDTGYYDETREFQTHIFEQLISLGERMTGEPL